MKLLKVAGAVLIGYMAVVMIFESLLGYFQPSNERTLLLETTSAAGEASSRVLARLQHGENLYVAVNHWPRGWYRNVLENSSVRVSAEGTTGTYEAIPVTDPAEFAQVDGEFSRGLGFLVLTGFPPRELVRLEPR